MDTLATIEYVKLSKSTGHFTVLLSLDTPLFLKVTNSKLVTDLVANKFMLELKLGDFLNTADMSSWTLQDNRVVFAFAVYPGTAAEKEDERSLAQNFWDCFGFYLESRDISYSVVESTPNKVVFNLHI